MTNEAVQNQCKKRREKSRFLFVCLVLFFLFFSVNHFFRTRAEQLPVKTYTSADGLGSSYVNYLMRDSRGFMWFCTRDGLSRFDGSRFITYQIGDKLSPPGVEVITETRNGVYWIGTTGGLYRFNSNAVSNPKITNSGRPVLNAEFISEVRGAPYEDGSGNLWLGTGGGLFRLVEKDSKVDLQHINLNLPPNPARHFTVNNLSQAKDGSLWMNSYWGVIRRLPDERVVYYPHEKPVSEGSTSILTDKEGRVWLARDLEFYIFIPDPIESLPKNEKVITQHLKPTAIIRLKEKGVRIPEKPGDVFQYIGDDFSFEHPSKRLLQTADGHVWMTIADKLLEFDGNDFHLYTAAQGLAKAMARLAEDSAGNLWIGGSTGLVRLDRKGLTSYDEADGLKSARIHSISEDRDGTLYFANGDFFLSKFNGKDFRTVHPRVSSDSRMLWTSRCAFLDSTGQFWILTHEKLYRFAAISDFDLLGRLKPLATYSSRDGLKSDGMFQIFEDKRGDIWVSTQGTNAEGHGLSRWNRAEDKFRTFTEAEGFPSGKAPSSFAEDGNGNLWMGFYEGGIVRYANGRFTEFTTKDGLPDGLIADLHVDQKGSLWIVSSIGGLARIDDINVEHPRFTFYTTDNGLSSNNIRTITEDLYGNIYIGTARGVDRITPEPWRVKHYSINDGLASDFVVDSHCDRSGVLWFATTNGLSRLIPLPNEKPSDTPVWIGGLRISGLAQPISELGNTEIANIELTHTQNNFQIDFFGLNFRPGEVLRYEYKLEGADSDWSAPTEQRTVTYATLQPGTYRFLVRAVNADGNHSEKPAVISFKILPPIWRRWWFIAACLLVVSLVGFAFIRSRLEASKALQQEREERLKELERVRTRIATDLHDDIGASLTQIAVLSEVARKTSAVNNGKQITEPLKKISSVSNELVETMSDIVWAINPHKDHLSDLAQRMRRFASDVFAAKQISFHFKTPSLKIHAPLGANIRREVFLIFKESVNNVVKHSDCSNVEIDFKVEGKMLTLKLQDNGCGFNVSSYETNGNNASTNGKGGNGLLNMKRRAKELGGDYIIDSQSGKGTSVILRVPLIVKEI